MNNITINKKMKVMTIVGTRPEIIRLSRVMVALDIHCEHIIVHTGQNYDFELNQVFLMILGSVNLIIFFMLLEELALKR